MAHAQVDAVPLILRDQAAGVLTLTLNRGERFNPLSSAMIAALAAELDAIAGDPSVQVVILAAGGKGFCAGHDLEGDARARGRQGVAARASSTSAAG